MNALVKIATILFFAAVASVQALNVKLHGINFDFRQGPDWDPNKCKPESVVKEELQLLSAITSNVRTYALSDCPIEPILKATKELNLTIWLGLWVGPDPKIFAKELKVLSTLISKKLIDDSVVGINIGSEAIYRGDVTVESALLNYNKVKSMIKKAGLKIPLSITDINIQDYPSVIEAVDVVTANLFPFWSQIPVFNRSAVWELYSSMQGLVNVSNDKPIIITETGWSTAGSHENASDPTGANAAQYLEDFLVMAEKEKWKYYYFTGFDTPYKIEQFEDPLTVEQGFGLFDANKTLKPEIAALNINVKGAGPADRIPTNDAGGAESTKESSSRSTLQVTFPTLVFIGLTTIFVSLV